MEAFRLISMTDFVLEIDKEWENTSKPFSENKALMKICKYATFLKQPLKLGFFVPCYADGQVHEKPGDLIYQLAEENDHAASKWAIEEYNEAKESVLFKGFEIEDIGLGSFAIRKNGWILMRCSKSIGAKWENRDAYLNIESLTHFKLELTDSTIKQIGL